MKKTLLLLSLLLTINVFSQTNYTLTLNGVGLQRSTLNSDSIFSYPYPLQAPYTFNTNSNSFSFPSGTYTISFGYVNWSGDTYLDITNNSDILSYTLPPSTVPTGTMIPITYTTVVFTTTSTMNNLKFVGNFGVSSYVNFKLTRPIITTNSVGLNELNTLPVIFYSVSNSIYIQNDKNIENVKIEVFNLSGELIYSNQLSSNKIDLNVSNGLYIVKLSKDNQYSIKKIIINN
ncbi:MAG: T9SS type A sorting domain-containing protein [Bacteroidetes bacterium]|nr:T9SS type A sorting domain-containing protein [Bacteroidota bacterium]